MAAARAGRSRLEGELWSKLPPNVLELVLSFLPVPVLCRFRTVCNGWNELLCGSSFHGLCDQNGEQHKVCFLTRYKVKDGYSCIDLAVKGTTCFLDLDEKRWYSIKGPKDRGFDTRVVGMDDSLVAEFWCEDESERDFDDTPTVSCVSMSDPISKMNWSLEPPFFECPDDDELPTLVVAADRASSSFRVFLLDNSGGQRALLWVYESSTDKWKCVGNNPPTCPEAIPLTKATSAVFFRGDLYAILSPIYRETCFLTRYDCQEDKWSMIIEDVPDQPAHPELHVSGNRLLMTFWQSARPLTAKAKLPADTMLEMVEVQIAENSALRRVFEIPLESLEHFAGETMDDLACVAPRVNSDGSCTSVALMSSSSGRVICYDLLSQLAEIFPAHPLRNPKKTEQRNRRRYPHMRYWGTHQKLCFRDLLRKKPLSDPPVYMPKGRRW